MKSRWQPPIAVAPKTVAVSTAQAVTRTVSAGFDTTGSFEADETSDIAPLVAGRVIATPVNVGDFVKQGQVICELDHRDAQLKLDQAKAQLDQATAGLRQAQSRIGWNGSGNVRSEQPAGGGGRAGKLRIRAGHGAACRGGREAL